MYKFFMAQIMSEQVLTAKEVAAHLKVNERTVDRMASAGKIPAFKMRASWRFKNEEVSSWINSHHNQTTNLDKGV